MISPAGPPEVEDYAGLEHSRWKLARGRRLTEGFTESPEVELERQEHRLSMALAKVVYDRRVELGLSQSELAARAGLTQGKISRIEGSDTVPTLPLLAKLAKGLDASLNIAIDVFDLPIRQDEPDGLAVVPKWCHS